MIDLKQGRAFHAAHQEQLTMAMRNDRLDSNMSDSRREFLQQMLAGGAALTSLAAATAYALPSADAPAPAASATTADSETIAVTLAKFAHTLRYEDLPE
jgi:hypothetical protein